MATITEDYCSKEIYRLLIEKGFDGEIHTTFDKEGYTQPSITLQMTMKWLREVHNTFISIIYENDGVFVVSLKVPLKGVDCLIDDKHNCWFTYEEAAEAAIKFCLERII